MPQISEMSHPAGLSFAMQRKVVLLRDTENLAWHKIAERVQNLNKEPTTKQTCINVYNRFQRKAGRVKPKYSRCGRKPYKVTRDVKKHLVKTLVKLRGKCTCTATTLQRELCKDMGVTVNPRHIRRVLSEAGYSWLPRNGKRIYSKDMEQKRVAFASKVLEMTPKQLKTYFSMCMDGVVFVIPPADPIDRENFVKHGDTHCWRKPDEATKKVAQGGHRLKYKPQAPPARTVPLWGGVGAKGFGLISFHQRRKVDGNEWKKIAVKSGRLVSACQVSCGRKRGPYRVCE